MKILAFDPSGNFHEGKGTTGFCLAVDGHLAETGRLHAGDYSKDTEYWDAHIQLIEKETPSHIVYEGYRLYNHKGMKAASQSNSILETPKLIGVLEHHAYKMNIPTTLQFAKDVKSRWSDQVLLSKGIISQNGKSYYFNNKKLAVHEIDSIRHMMHYLRYKRKEQ